MKALKGKRALVTGGSRGIGAGIALSLAESGADVAITFARSQRDADEVVKTIHGMGRKAFAIQADSGDAVQAKQSVVRAAELLGGLDILVNNAGIAIQVPVAEISAQQIDDLMNTNVRGVILATQAAIPLLPKDGRIITIGSAGADRIVGEAGTVYYMTKSALQAFTRGLARDLGARGITVNLVQPGSTDTQMNPAGGEFADFQRALIPLGRFNEPRDVAAAVEFLASPAAKQITGVILNVDGGLNT